MQITDALKRIEARQVEQAATLADMASALETIVATQGLTLERLEAIQAWLQPREDGEAGDDLGELLRRLTAAVEGMQVEMRDLPDRIAHALRAE